MQKGYKCACAYHKTKHAYETIKSKNIIFMDGNVKIADVAEKYQANGFLCQKNRCGKCCRKIRPIYIR